MNVFLHSLAMYLSNIDQDIEIFASRTPIHGKQLSPSAREYFQHRRSDLSPEAKLESI